MARFFIFIPLLILGIPAQSQDKNYASDIVDTLTSANMSGRGYVNNGDRIAAQFIANEFKKHELQGYEKNYLQPFDISVNTFPDTITVRIDNKLLIAGKDYILSSSSPSVSGTFEVIRDNNPVIRSKADYDSLKLLYTNKVIITEKEEAKHNIYDYPGAAGTIFLTDDKLWWHISNGQQFKDHFTLKVARNRFPDSTKVIHLNAKNEYFAKYQTQNVFGYIKGALVPDSTIVFTAHYDHLGMMGAESYFPGGNDNASGTAMLLDLARHYSADENIPDYSMVFIAFGAEEMGLLGSYYFVSDPLIPLDNIKFLINLDMVGSGSDGIKVVNGSVFNKEYDLLVNINNKNKFLRQINARGAAANSDHYPFYEKRVPCFFIYTLGKECPEYHTVYDTPENVPFTEYEDLFRLLLNFAKKL